MSTTNGHKAPKRPNFLVIVADGGFKARQKLISQTWVTLTLDAMARRSVL
jgi:hypothetical protein